MNVGEMKARDLRNNQTNEKLLVSLKFQLLEPTYRSQTTVGKGKGKAVEKSVPEKRSREPGPLLSESGSSLKIKRTRRT
jgi:hypothetical protein